MPINPFKAGRAVGKGVRYLTQLGSKIGKGLGSSVDKLGAGTRNTQAAAIKGVRGVRDAAANAGAAARRGVRDARAGYETGRHGGLHLSDVAETPAQKYHHGKMAEAGRANFIQANAPNRDKYIKANKSPMKGVSPADYDSWAKKNPGIKAAADKMRGNKDIYGRPTGGSSSYNDPNRDAVFRKKMEKYLPGGGAVWDDPSINPKFKNRMTKYKPKTGGGGIINKPPRRPTSGAGDYMSDFGGKNYSKFVKGPDFMTKPTIVPKPSKSGMSKNRRAGIIAGASIAAGYGIHKGNDALQNHYRQQKNAARGGM